MADLAAQSSSLTYTPSPPRFRVVLPDLSLVLDGHVMPHQRREKVRFEPFAAVLGETDAAKKSEPLRDAPPHCPSSSRKPSTPVNHRRQTISPAARKSFSDNKDEDDEEPAHGEHDRGPKGKDNDLSSPSSFSVDSFTFERVKKRSSSVSEPFAFILGSSEKENCQRKPTEQPTKRNDDAAFTSTTSARPPVPKARPPVPRKPPARTEARAIGGEDSWQRNIQEAKRLRELVETKRRTGIQLSRLLSTHVTQKRAQDTAARRHELLQKTEQEVDFKASVYQDHRKALAEDVDASRRKSIAAREKLRLNRREGDKQLQMMRIEEDKALHDERYEASVAQRTFESDRAKQRRESLALRAQQASFSRDQVMLMSQEEMQKEHESFELKFQAAKDTEVYLHSEAEKRRQSLAGRNEHARQQRQAEADRNAEHAKKDHESFELDLSAYRDTVEYERAMKLRDRNSLAHRGLEARRRRIKEEQLRAAQLEKEHDSYELTFAGERDVDAHRQKLKRLQRDENALLDSECRRKARVMDELRQLEREKEAESFVLKRAGEKDAEKYLERLAADRRKSLQQRGEQTLYGRKVEELQRVTELQKQQQDEKLRAACHKDMEEYRKACEERDRLSLQFRQKEARRKRLEEKDEAEKQRQQEHHSFELKTEDRKNVEEYVKECKQRRRMSLACRAKEKKRHAQWKQQQTQREIKQQRQVAHANMMDKHYEELARHEERLRLTQEAIRHSGFALNPSLFPMG